MRKILILLSVILFGSLLSSQKEDLQFIVGLYGDKNYDLAESELLKFLQENTKSKFLPKAEYLLGNIYYNKNEYQKALNQYRRLKKMLPQYDDKITLSIGKCYYYLKDFKKSKTVLSNYKYETKLYEVYYYLSLIAFEQGDYAQSILECKKSLENKYTNFVQTQLLRNYISIDKDKLAKQTLLASKSNESFFENVILYFSYLLEREKYKEIIVYKVSNFPSGSFFFLDYQTIRGIAFYYLADYQKSVEILETIKTDKGKFYYALSLFRLGNSELAKKIFVDLINSNSQEISLNSRLYLIRIKSISQPMNAIYDLIEFLKNDKSGRFSGPAFYLMGWNYYKMKDYQNSQIYLKKSLEINQDKKSSDNTLYLYADALFEMEQFQESKENLSKYISEYKNGSFIDEAYYKLAIIYYNQQEIKKAKVKFKTLISLYPKSSKLAMSHFYLGDIYFKEKNYTMAEKNFLKSLDLQDNQSTYSRLAGVYYSQGKYQLSSKYLKKVKEVNLYEKYLLQGDIEYKSQKYQLALKNYNLALESKGAIKEDISKRIAKVYYGVGQYQKAVSIYVELYSLYQKKSYLLLIAECYFAKENYEESSNYFQKYIELTKNAKDNVIISLANSYYNQEKYLESVEYYKKLIYTKGEFVSQAIDGIFWASSVYEGINFIAIMDDIFSLHDDKNLKKQIISKKIEFYLANENYKNVIKESKNYLVLAPDERKVIGSLIVAYIELRQYNNAQKVFLSMKVLDEELTYEWAKMNIILNDTTAALKNLQLATSKSKQEKIWLFYLEILAQKNSPLFLSKYKEFLKFAQNIFLEKADLFKIEYLILNKEYILAKRSIDKLLQSSHTQIVAKANYFGALNLFEQKNYSKALIIFLRTAYLFPELEDLVRDSKKQAIYCHYQLKEIEKAREIFENLRDKLSEKEKKDITFMLGGTYEKENI